jgi:hypothetical protein
LEIAFTETAQQTVITNDASHAKLLLSLVQNGYLISIPSVIVIDVLSFEKCGTLPILIWSQLNLNKSPHQRVR